MATFIPNSYQTPNFYIDHVMHLLTPEEFVILMFAAREILGWQTSVEERQKDLLLEEFLNGCNDKTGFQRSFGCGLSRKMIQKAIAKLCKFGLMEKRKTQKGSRFFLNLDTDDIDWEALIHRKEERVHNNIKRTQSARNHQHDASI